MYLKLEYEGREDRVGKVREHGSERALYQYPSTMNLGWTLERVGGTGESYRPVATVT